MTISPGIAYLIGSVICSVSVSVLLKMARARGIDIRQAIVVNYAVAAFLAWLFLRPDLGSVSPATISWGILIPLGVLLPSVFVAMGRAVDHAGIVRSDAAQRLSLFISLLAAFVFLGDVLTLRKGVAIAVGLTALLCLLLRPAPKHTANAAVLGAARRDAAVGAASRHEPASRGLGGAGAFWLLAVWLGYGAGDILFKLMALSGLAFAATLFSAFVLAGVLLALYLGIRRVRWHAASLLGGVPLGILNFANILTYVRAHQNLANDPALVFSAMNIGVISLGTLIGAWVFRERLGPLNLLGLALALAAIVLMTPW
jgi:drug/metabolite transporter (DMT)-like permease